MDLGIGGRSKSDSSHHTPSESLGEFELPAPTTLDSSLRGLR